MPQRGITNAKQLRTAFASAIHQNLDSADHGEHHAATILAAMTNCHFSVGHDRAVLASINDIALNAHYYLGANLPTPTITQRLNDAPMGLLNMDQPAERFAAL